MAARYRARLADLWTEQGGLCCWCRRLCFLARDVTHYAGAWPFPRLVMAGDYARWVEIFGHRFTTGTVEHIVARKDGGSHADSNLAMACYECNVRRADMTPEDFIAWLGLDPALLGEVASS